MRFAPLVLVLASAVQAQEPAAELARLRETVKLQREEIRLLEEQVALQQKLLQLNDRLGDVRAKALDEVARRIGAVPVAPMPEAPDPSAEGRRAAQLLAGGPGWVFGRSAGRVTGVSASGYVEYALPWPGDDPRPLAVTRTSAEGVADVGTIRPVKRVGEVWFGRFAAREGGPALPAVGDAVRRP